MQLRRDNSDYSLSAATDAPISIQGALDHYFMCKFHPIFGIQYIRKFRSAWGAVLKLSRLGNYGIFFASLFTRLWYMDYFDWLRLEKQNWCPHWNPLRQQVSVRIIGTSIAVV